MNAYKITTKNFEKSFVVATNAENALREFKRYIRKLETERGGALSLNAKEIVKVKLIGNIENI